MQIIAHRGFWRQKNEQNSQEALLGAIEHGWGIETDINHLNGTLVISHDVPDGTAKCLSFEKLILATMGNKKSDGVVLALNIKADGLERKIIDAFSKIGRKPKNFFFFDMNAPTHAAFSRVFEKECISTRISDIEPEPVLYEKSGWVWVDGFEKDWNDSERIGKFLKDGKRVVFVSPELQKRDKAKFWNFAKQFAKNPNVCICTDFPEEADRFFNG
ncbi:MAG: phosphodiesterase [Candidatus Micrarchaeia archaeon]|jgi:hypothetical protein